MSRKCRGKLIRRFIRVRIVDATDADNQQVIWEQDFFNSKDCMSSEIREAVYNKVLELDSKFNFADYENCPYYVIYYIEITEYTKETVERIEHIDDCIDYVMNL